MAGHLPITGRHGDDGTTQVVHPRDRASHHVQRPVGQAVHVAGVGLALGMRGAVLLEPGQEDTAEFMAENLLSSEGITVPKY